jgi:hypothetical protein
MNADAQFHEYVKLAKIRVHEYLLYKDSTSLKIAAFAYGRVVGACYASDPRPDRWKKDMEELEQLVHSAEVM